MGVHSVWGHSEDSAIEMSVRGREEGREREKEKEKEKERGGGGGGGGGFIDCL